MSGNSKDELSDWPQRAVEWHILLREEDDDPEVWRHFEAWKAADPAREREWQQVLHTMGLLKQVPDKAFPLSGRRTMYWKRQLPRLGFSLCAAAAVAAVAVLLGPDVMLRWQADYLTGRQETRTLELADGSRAVLAPESAVALDFLDGHRHVRLLKGEALFTVRHDAAYPFAVIAGRLAVRDVGTVFDVRMKDDRTATVGVREGRVSIQDMSLREPPVCLDAGQQAVLHEGRLAIQEVEPGEVGSWTSGVFVAHDLQVAEIAATLEHYSSHGLLRVHGGKLSSERVTGTYSLKEPQRAFETLAQGQGAYVVYLTPWVSIMTR